MIFLGVHYGHNATIAVFKDKKIIFCQSEERLNRIKNSTGFPEQTLKYIYNNIISPDEIDMAICSQRTVFGYLYMKKRNFEAFEAGSYLDPTFNKQGKLRQAILQTEIGWKLKAKKIGVVEKNVKIRNEAAEYFSRSLDLPQEKIIHLDHHTAHAYSTVPNIKEWGKVLIFTLDGVGDWTCATVNHFENDKFINLQRTNHRNSLGYYYSAITEIMGMKSGAHEFKVMGLAPYGNKKYYNKILNDLRDLINVSDDGEWVSKINPAKINKSLEALIRFQRFDNVAGAIQELTEELIIKWINFWIRKTGIKNIAVSGGVFMNVKVCQKVAEMESVEKIYVMPSGADESSALGCAFWYALNYTPMQKIEPIKELYLGVEFSDNDIAQTIKDMEANNRYSISRHDNINEVIGSLLAENKIVARSTGRMEFGARALGNRSILANAAYLENLNIINSSIKSRDFWMPFCPSIIEEDGHRYVKNYEKIFAPYMSITFDSTEEAKKDLKASMHPKDGTIRPQIVTKEWNPDYYEIISAFKKKTGIGGILNTSFNLHGEPNVCSPKDAIQTMDNSGLQYLTMNNYLFIKKDSQNTLG
ncbi:MAG: carbamoyltransferase C-terminal domain-containing protein [Ignavibacteriaceae bacterium]